MPGHQKSQERTHGEDLQICSEIQGPVVARVSGAKEEPSPASSQPLMPGTLHEAPVVVTPSTPEELQNSCSSPIAIVAPSLIQSSEGSSNKEEESVPSTSEMASVHEHMPKSVLDEKVAFLVNFLLLKYQSKEPVRKADMLKFVMEEDEARFHEIFLRASDRLEMVFGLEVKEMDPINQYYGLSIKLGLTYDGMLNDEENIPKTGLLILMLGVIFMKGNRATEEEIWEVLKMTGIRRDEKHFIFGDARQLIAHEFVSEKYLEYQQVANSDPVQYEFLWGPRAHAETSKMKVLEFLAKVHRTDPSDFSAQYEEALLEEEARALGRISMESDSSSVATASSSARGGSFSSV
ncbi:Melanoma-associated antigen B16 [Sciurus carolinensis]|uniref:Melanoma-associated antigen B16 n=1 Tax=Sciurus carolinensis TaxID=30640 RepID=A0AA41SQA9_SCICA|nr:melanoma-associated antigen B16 [Sciurus carolinensis]MBZ3869116.1 Melanoma-associated antigen B16 [Sciurus carolinensis]